MSKERLVELIRNIEFECPTNCARLVERRDCNECRYEQIADYLLASGKVIVTPVGVGDTVWYFSKNPLNLSVQANTIYEAKVVRIVTTHLGTYLVIQIRNECGCTEIPDITYFGKEVFLTRSQAKAKLIEEKEQYAPFIGSKEDREGH